MKLHPFYLSLLFFCFFTNTNYAQDWPALDRFKAANEAMPPAAFDEHRVVFMGNSITEFWSVNRPDFFAGKPYINRGISGQTTPQMLVRFRQDVIELEPEIVVILAGINDIAGNTGPSTVDMIFDNIISMAELAVANDIKVILCSVLPAYDFPWRPGLEPAGKVLELNRQLKDYAGTHNLMYLDYHTPMANEQQGLKEELGDDGVHPNQAGYAMMEPLLDRAIRKAITKK